MPYWEELEWNDADDVHSAGDVDIPPTAHHMQAKAEIDLLVDEGAIGHDEGARALRMWKAENQGDEKSKLGAIDMLEKHGVISGDEAEDLRGRVGAAPA